ncbi:MAG: hypothetical protein EPO02_08980 [Nitrospirae bacterium]|nr:MAG: hypothetical protein EPO02_08980 [Nitrospirota bacterium]
MKTLRIYVQQWAMFLAVGLVLAGYPLHGQAMSLFMGGEEQKTSPPPPKPVVAKPPSTAGQPALQPTPPVGSMQPQGAGSPAPQVAPSPTAGALPLPAVPGSPAAPSAGASTPKPGAAQTPMQPTAPAQTTQGSPSPTAPATSAPTSGAVQPLTSSGQAAGTGTPAAAASAKALASVEAGEGYTYDPKSRRDPFQSLTRLVKVDKTRAEMPPLQRVQISDLKLLGIMWGGYGYYALVQTPDGKGYTVKEGMLMGTNNGVITTITDRAIIVSEPSIDITGNKSTKDVELLLRPKEVS